MNYYIIQICNALILFIAFFQSIDAIGQERNLTNIRKLTSGGDNAEAYFSPNGRSLVMQVTNPKKGVQCDQIYTLDLGQNNSELKLVSTGNGRTTCSYFMPDGKHILYASTHESNKDCPPKPAPRSDGKYLWPVYPEFDIYIANLNGKIKKKLTDAPGYDAEATLSPDGKMIVFTSTRSGDLELWTMNVDGTHLKQITFGLGYDGGAFFSHDSKKLVFRSSRPKTEKAIEEYKSLLNEGLVAPTEMELYTCNVDGSGLKQITNLGKANWAPYFTPDDSRIIFSSNHHSTMGYDFQLFTIDTSGKNLRQITYFSKFNSFAMFSPNGGGKIAFSSNRDQDEIRETNVFIADWIPTDLQELPNRDLFKRHIGYLASDSLKGRLAGSLNELLAANYISSYFSKIGLSFYQSKQFIHPFKYTYNGNPHGGDNAAHKEEINARNVAGFLDNKAEKTIIIGAHYDHLGFNEHHNSLNSSKEKQIHNGADDNASGTAAVMELARMLSQNNEIEKVNYLFVCFSGEEDGLMGSKSFAKKVKEAGLNVAMMINMDMIGRLDSMKKLYISGVGTSNGFEDLVNRYKPGGFNLILDSSGTGPTDHTSFYLQDYPVLNFFTGSHTDYHKPSDDIEKVNFEGVELITDFIFRLSLGCAELDSIPFYKTRTKSTKKAASFKVTLGVMPDYQDYGDGLHLDAVLEDRVAQKAGIVASDIIMQIGDCEIKEIYSYMKCLSTYKKGDQANVKIKRGEEMLIKKVTF